MTIDELYMCIEQNNVQQIHPIITYIQTSYPEAIYDSIHKYKIPMWIFNNEYIGIGCRKQYISIYFSSSISPQVIKNLTPFCRVQKTCVNFSYKRELPLEAIYQGIDECFK